MFIAAAFFLTAGSGTVAASEPTAVTLTDHAAIRVNNDTDLAQLITDNSWTGDGSAGSPYMITALKIDALGGPTAIFIGNTTAHVVISDCELFNAAYVNWPYAYGSAIMLYNTANIAVENNNIHDCEYGGVDVIQSEGTIVHNNTCTSVDYGVDLYMSEGAVVTYNVISSSPYGGVYIYWSNDSVVSNNVCHGSSYGLYLSLADGNTISDNDFSQNGYGMYIFDHSTNNTLVSNNCSGSSDYGIYMEYSNLNTISYSNCSNNGNQGVYLYYCENNTISHNTLNGNGGDGIFVQYCYNNTISYNAAANNGDGAHLDYSNYNTVTGNNFSSNLDGIYMYIAAHNLITGNTCDNNLYDGIYLNYECNNNTISNNECNKNSQYGSITDCGLQIRNSDYNIISGNDVSDNWYNNIGVFTSDNNIISGNAIHGSSYSAVYLRDGSCFNTISGNDCTNDTQSGYGIGLENGCYNNTVTGNDVSGRYYGLIAYASFNNIFADNLCDVCYVGIYLDYYAHDNTVTDNGATGCGYGIYEYYYSYSNMINGNVFANCEYYGIYLGYNCHDDTLADNEIKYCDYGIYVQQCYDMVIEWNECNYDMVGIILYSSTGCTLANNTCIDYYDGISATQSHAAIIENNTCMGMGTNRGISILGSSACKIVYNDCSGYEFGIYVSGNGYGTIGGETIAHNTCNYCIYDGIYADYCSGSTIDSNICTGNNDCGVRIVLGCDGNTISNNMLTGNGGAGIFIGDGSDGTLVWKNTVSGNYMGIEIVGSSHVSVVDGNAIIDNEYYGLYMDYASGTYAYNNMFIGNNGATEVFDEDHVQAYANGPVNMDSGSYGNYWADWVSPDENNDGIVDNYYYIDGTSNYDRYPLAITLDIVSPASGSAQSDLVAMVSGEGRSIYFGIDELTWYNAATGVSGVCSGTSSWSADIELKTGENLITVTMYCSNGMEITDTVMIYRDTTAPTATITFPSAGGYATPDVNMKWTASDDYSGVWTTKVALDDGWWVFVDGDSYMFEGLSQGAHVLHLKVTDKCGNTYETSVSFIVDAVDPTIEITSPAEGYHNNTGSVMLKWTASDAMSGIDYYLVSADGKTWTKVNVTSFLLSGLDEGEYTVLVRAYDKAGNYNETSVGIVVDMTAPTAGITPSGAGNPIDAVIRVEFSEAMDKSSVTIVVSGVTGTVSWSDNVATFTPSSLTAGAQYIVVVSGKDLAGNAFTANGTFSIASTGSITGRLIDADGNPMANMTVTLDNGMSVKTDADGRFAFDNVSPGTHELKVSADGYDDATREITVEAGKTIDAHTMQLEESSNDNTTIIIAIAAIVIIVFLAGAAFVMNRKK